MNSPAAGDSGSLSRANEIDRVCDRFEHAWRTGTPLSIEECLSTVRPESQTDLLEELIVVEYELRRAQGDDVSLADYVRRFPLAANVLRRIPDRASSSGQQRRTGSAQLQATEHLFEAGQWIGRFRLNVQLGQGTFGSVWKAFDSRLERFVAVKLPRHQLLPEARRDQFLKEARAAASLRHRHVVSIYEIVDTEPFSFIVSELIDGESLRDRLRSGPVPLDWAIRTMHGVALGLAHAHEQGLVHRDLKPANILIDRQDMALITDFGLAQRPAADFESTSFGRVVGTPAYMAPEQSLGLAAVDHRADIYSAGAVLYELITGRTPFAGDASSVLSDLLVREPVAPRSIRLDVPKAVESICLRCLSKSPEDRFQSATELAEALLTSLNEATLDSGGRSDRPLSRRALLLAGGTASLGLCAWWIWSRPRDWRLTQLSTDPLLCQVSAVLLDESGEPIPSRLFSLAERTPAEFELPPGNYLFTAVAEDGRFHEVLRHVPSATEGSPSAAIGGTWSKTDRGIQLPAIRVPPAGMTRGMIEVPAGDYRGPSDTWQVPFFFADPQLLPGTLIEDLKLSRQRFSTTPDGATLLARFEHAFDVAEKLGKRLPSFAEAQLLFATRPEGWQSSSTVWEWTTTAPTWSGAPAEAKEAALRTPERCRLIVADIRAPQSSASKQIGKLAVRIHREFALDGGGVLTGLRLIRSSKPRLRPEDFVRVSSS